MRKWTGLLVVGLVGLAAAVPALVLRAQAPSPDRHLAFDVVSIKQAAVPDSLVSTLSRNGACGKSNVTMLPLYGLERIPAF